MRLIPYTIHLYTYKNTCHANTHANIHDMSCRYFTLAYHATYYMPCFLKLFLICYKKFFIAIAEFEAEIVKFCNNTPFGVLRNKSYRA